MRARRKRAVSLLVTSVVVTGLLLPATAASRSGAADPVTAASGGRALRSGVAGSGAERPDAPIGPVDPAGRPAPETAVTHVADLAVEPPPQPARGAPEELFGADCATRIEGSQVKAHCHNRFPGTDLVRLHVECDRWWDVDGDSAPLAVVPSGRSELNGRCWKEVRSAWVSHQRQ
ncbi:hypothetical protein ABT084_28115 [Streptomyces sp. NPDC002138]|uniref:hypothetical protein n=1 Tax=Streptomyces sp. NPDC002138 TaxID=3154410 RepID=UPI00331EE1AF